MKINVSSGIVLLSDSGKKLISVTLSFDKIPDDLIKNINQNELLDLKNGDIKKIIFSGDFKKSNSLEIFFLPPD